MKFHSAISVWSKTFCLVQLFAAMASPSIAVAAEPIESRDIYLHTFSHFSFPTNVGAFYEVVLGLKPTTVRDSVHGQWVEYQFGRCALAIGSAPMFKPSPDGCSAALEVEDFDAAIKQLRENSVKFRIGPMQATVCRMAMVFDPDGNSICIHNAERKLID